MHILRKKPTKKPLFSMSKVAQKLNKRYELEWKRILSVIIWTTEIKDISILVILISVLRITYQKRRKQEECKNSRRKFRQEF